MVAIPSLLSATAVFVTVVLAKTPNHSYAPASVKCPAKPILRSADSLSPQEQDYLNGRWSASQSALKGFISRLNLQDTNVDDLFWTDKDGTRNKINVGIAIPGGGYRAHCMGAGVLQALDARETNKKGRLSGLLQGASHMTGVSGGAWLVGSLYLNDFPTVSSLRNNKNIWKFTSDLVEPGSSTYVNTLLDYANIAADLVRKAAAGFPVSLTDVYGRLLSYQFVDSSNAARDMEWRDIADFASFRSHDGPFPILTTLGQITTPGTSLNSTIFEITPHEIGSYGPSVHGFADLKYAGSALDNGKTIDGNCNTGYDNAGFFMGASSSVFNTVIHWETINDGAFISALGDLAGQIFDSTRLNLAVMNPNPFKNYTPGSDGKFALSTSEVVTSDHLGFVDGATDDELLSFWPLLQKDRNIDIILALDVSVDTKYQWPNGKTMLMSYGRSQTPENHPDVAGFGHVVFPNVPDTNSFINLGLTTEPTFFGCYARDYAPQSTLDAGDFSAVPPIIVYVANTPITHMTNVSGLATRYQQDQIEAWYDAGFQLFDQTDVDDWPTCVGCATIQRERERQGQYTPTDQCKQCLDKYCWSGKVDPRNPDLAGLHNNPDYKSKSKYAM